MSKTHLDISQLDEIIESTISAVEKGQNQIYKIFENTKQECERLELELQKIKILVKETVEAVDKLIKLEQKAKQRLVIVSRNFEKYTEEDIRAAYEEAKDVQIRLSLEQQKELQLRDKRDEMERSYRNMLNILNQAEHLMFQVGAALGFLKGNLEDVSVHLLDLKEKKELAGKIIKAQEEERKRVARDIHDGPAQTFANIIIQTEICERLLDVNQGEAKKELKLLKDIVRASLKELRKIIFDLRPASLDDLGLMAVARRYCEEFQEETGIITEFKFFGNKARLSSDIEVSLFRVIQESLTNVKKHSQADTVIVKLEIRPEFVMLSIVDNGVGFEYDKASEDEKGTYHFGLMTIKERVELLDGTINIESALGKGTKINISIPTEYN